jgi:hypothetical protein
MNYGNKANEMAQPFKRNSQRHSLWRAGYAMQLNQEIDASTIFAEKEQWINTQYLNMYITYIYICSVNYPVVICALKLLGTRHFGWRSSEYLL